MRHSRKHYQAAFTIVELLIVIVVIAILAAISTVAYSGIQNRARETRRQNDMTAIAKAITAYDIANEGVPRTFSYTNISTSGGWDYSLNPD